MTNSQYMNIAGYVDVPQTPNKRLSSACIPKPFDIASKLLNDNGFPVTDVERNSELRIQEGSTSNFSAAGNYTKEGWIYAPRDDFVYFDPESIILKYAQEATQLTKEGREFLISWEQLEERKPHLIKVRLNFLGYQEGCTSGFTIPSNRLADEELTNRVFGCQAQLYGNFLREIGRHTFPILLDSRNRIDEQKQPFVRQNWFHGFLDHGGLCSYEGGLWCGFGVRGVRENSVKPRKTAEKKGKFGIGSKNGN